ncbi:MAG TPA: TonB-dependent receptor, partial [Candidatus Binatia bacterium]|nr:TonB-dependent receptor [Candidatus Binatia bacterium]
GNFMYQDADRRLRDLPVPFEALVDLKGDDRALSGELQHLFRSTYVNIVSGIGHFNVDSQDRINIRMSLPPILLPIDLFTVDRDVRHTNLYIYSYTRLPRNLVLSLGGSGDFFDSDRPGAKDQNQFNPKFGVSWNPLPNTTMRVAAFRTLKRTLITNQTLEPTQVAGFNQFFDDLNTTKAWRYGAAVDQKLSGNIFGGVEYTFRDLEVPFITSTDTGGQTQREVDWNENLVRLYLFWTPHNWLALSTGYEWGRFHRDQQFADGAKRVETDRVPLAINFFHPSGLSASLKATYVNQRGVFQRIAATSFEFGKDDFWTVDAALNYRLPKRYGFITLGVTNLFDKKFKHFDTDRGSVDRNPRVIPDRVFFAGLTLAFP